MKRLSLALLGLSAVVVVACDDGDDETGETGICPNSIVSTFPQDGDTTAYYRTTIEVEFDDAEESATITIADAGGTAVAGTEMWVDDTYVFTPTLPLASSVAHTISVTYSCGTAEVGFTTSEVGGATDAAGLVGNSYALDLSSGRFVQPEGIGSLLGDYLTQQVLMGITSVDTGTNEIVMLGAIAEVDETSGDLEQDACSPTIPFPTATFVDNPFFSVGPQDTSISVAGFTIEINDLFISGAFSPDASYIAGAVLAGSIDTRPLVPLLNQGCDDSTSENYPCDDNAICSLAATLDIACEMCAGGTKDWCGDDGTGDLGDQCCLSLYVDSISAVEHVDASSVPIPVQELSEPTAIPYDAATDYCVVNSAQCSTEDECTVTR